MRTVYAKIDICLRLKKETEDFIGQDVWEFSVQRIWVPVETSLNMWFSYRGEAGEGRWMDNVE